MNRLAIIRKNKLIFLTLGAIAILYIAFAIASSEITNLILSSTNPLTNDTNQNLSISFTTNATKNITNWYVNGRSIMLLNMPFEGGSNGTFTKDYSGYGNNGTVSGATWNSTGGYDGKGAYEFDGENNSINVSGSNVINVSISLWVNLKTSNNTNLFTKHGSYSFGIYDNLTFIVWMNNISYTLEANSGVTANSWTFVSAIFNSGNMTIYKNAVIVGSADYSAYGTKIDSSSNNGVMAGLDSNCSGNMSYIDKMGGYCIDQYEASMPSANSTNIGNSSDFARIVNPGTMQAVSQAGVVPWVSVNQTSSRIACNNAGKHLCTDSEWLSAANVWGRLYNLPTDLASAPYYCVTAAAYCAGKSYNGTGNGIVGAGGAACNTGKNKTGGISSCVSAEGVYDMTGNVYEWTNETLSVVTNPGYGANYYYYNGTGWINVTGTATKKYGDDATYFPANATNIAVLRGGGWYNGAYAGPFYAVLNNGPSGTSIDIGFRCCSQTSEWTSNKISSYSTPYTVYTGITYLHNDFNGTIDDVMIFNRSLSAQEIQALYNNRTDLIVSQETTLGENWSACVTPNDGYIDGSQVCSNNLTILNGASIISLVNPTDANISYLPRGNILINVTATDVDGLANITINLYNSTSLVNSSFKTTSPYYVNITSLLDGIYWFNATATDIVNALTSTTTYKVILDTVFPQVNFTGETLSSGSYTSANSMAVNISSSDTNSHYVVNDFDNSLIGWWRMERGNGTFFVDDKGGNNGTCSGTGCPTYSSAGAFGGSYGFDGNGRYVTTSNSIGTFPANASYTFSAWAKIADTSSTTYRRVLNLVNSGIFRPSLASYTNTFSFFLRNGNNVDSFVGTGAVTQDTWYHVVAVYDGLTNNQSIYLNGVWKQSVIPSNGTSAFNGILYIGATNNYNGSIDEVMIFNRTLSAGEIQSLYNATASQYYNNFTSLSDGTHTFKGYAVDAAGNKNNTEQRNVTVDTTMPNATLVVPDNLSYLNYSSSINFTANLSDNIGIKNATLFIYNNTGLVNQTTTTFSAGVVNTVIGTVVSLVDNVYTWFYSLFDFAGNIFTTGNRTMTVDTINPNVNILYPLNITYIINVSAINFTVSDTNLQACWLSLNSGVTNNSIACGNNLTELTSIEGTNIWRVYANDSAGNVNYSSVTFFKDTIPPVLTVYSPANVIYTSALIDIKASATDSNGISSYWYSIDGSANVSFTPNITILTSGYDVIHTIIIYVNDTSGNTVSQNITFDVMNPLSSGYEYSVYTGIGVNSIINSADDYIGLGRCHTHVTSSADYIGYPTVGYNYYSWLEYTEAQTTFGNGGISGVTGKVKV